MRRTHEIGLRAEQAVAQEMKRRGFRVTPFGRNYPVVDLSVTGATDFRVQVKCNDVQHIKFTGRKSTAGLLDTDFVIALMPASANRDLSFDSESMWTFVIPASIAQKAAMHVHTEYLADFEARNGRRASESFGPTIKFYRNVAWHNQARAWIWPFKDNWSALPPPA